MEETARSILKTFDRLSLTRLSATDLLGGEQNESAALASLAGLLRDRLLRESFGQYERTEAGRLEVAGPLDLTLLGRSGCHLCEVALREIEPLALEMGVDLRKVDIDTDGVLRERYNTEIPVLFLGRRELARHRIDARRLRDELLRVRTP